MITNGSFETEKNTGGSFDWKIGNTNGAEVSFDDSISFEGKRSLKITFNGKENVDLQQIGQIVALKPNTAYCLRANMETKGVTTKSGVKIEISGIGEAFTEHPSH